MLFTHPNRCPRCRERVTSFAAGCAICGSDLDPRRGDRVPLSRRVGSAWDALAARPTAGLALIVVALVAWLLLSRGLV